METCQGLLNELVKAGAFINVSDHQTISGVNCGRFKHESPTWERSSTNAGVISHLPHTVTYINPTKRGSTWRIIPLSNCLTNGWKNYTLDNNGWPTFSECPRYQVLCLSLWNTCPSELQGAVLDPAHPPTGILKVMDLWVIWFVAHVWQNYVIVKL